MMANALVPELGVRDFGESITFYRDLLGFEVMYERPDEGFAYLRLGGAELMIDQIGLGRTFALDDAAFEYPLGRGLNLQIAVTSIEPLIQRVEAAGIGFYLAPERRWYRTGDRESGNYQFVIADPDGYLLRFFEDMGTRPIASA